MAPLLPSILTPSPSRGLKGTKRSRFKADQAWGWVEGERSQASGGGWRRCHWQGLGSTCCLQVLVRGGGAGGPPGVSGTGLAVPAETVTGRASLATVPWGDLLRSRRRKSKGSAIPAPSRTAESGAPTLPVHILLASRSRPPYLDHSLPSLTSHLHDVPGDNVPSLDPLY